MTPRCLVAQPCLWVAAVGFILVQVADSGGRAQYVGGTVAALSDNVRGSIVTTDPQFFAFQAKGAAIRIPYEKINLLEYGQEVSRRYGLAILVSPVTLLSKKRRHFLTIGYTDEEGGLQAVVFRVEKDHVRPVLAGLEVRTGRRVEYQDEEAREAGR